MNKHPQRVELEAYIAGDYGCLKSLGLRWHLRRCKACRDLCEEIKAERLEQLDFAAEIKRYTAAAAQTEETLKTMTLSVTKPAAKKAP